MTLTASPPTQDVPDVDAGVIEQARARQRRHRCMAAAVVIAVVVAGLVAHEAGGGAPRNPSLKSADSSGLTPVAHEVNFKSRSGHAEASFTMREPSGVILLAQISVPRGVRAVVNATNPFGGSVRLTTITDRRDPSLSCRPHGGADVCTQAYERCPLNWATWRFHLVKLSGPSGPIRVNFVVGPAPSQT